MKFVFLVYIMHYSTISIAWLHILHGVNLFVHTGYDEVSESLVNQQHACSSCFKKQ